MRVILIKGRSGYDALRIFTDGLAEAFAARGYQPAVLDVPAEPDLAAALRREAAAGPPRKAGGWTSAPSPSADATA